MAAAVARSISTAVPVRTLATLSGREAAATLVRSTAGTTRVGSSRPISSLLLSRFVPAVSSRPSCVADRLVDRVPLVVRAGLRGCRLAHRAPGPCGVGRDLAERLVRLNQRAALRSGQVRIGLDCLNDLCRPIAWLFAAEQVGRNVERVGDRPEHLFRRGTKPTFDLGEVRVGDASHRRNLAHRQLGQLSLPADDLTESQLIIRRRLCSHSLSIRFTSARPERQRGMPR